MNNAVEIFNHFLSAFWIVAALGALHIFLREYQSLAALWNNELKGKSAAPVLLALRKRIIRRLLYLIGGSLLVLSAWALVIWLLNTFFVPAGLDISTTAASTGSPFDAFRRMAGMIAPLGVAGFLAAGTCFTLSAGERWLVAVGKLFATLTVVVLGFFFLFAALG